MKKLVKKEYQVEVPVYKCVVRHLCCECLQARIERCRRHCAQPAGGASQSTATAGPPASAEGGKITAGGSEPYPEGLPLVVTHKSMNGYGERHLPSMPFFLAQAVTPGNASYR